VKYLRTLLDDANGDTAESLRGRARAAMARLIEMVDARALVRGMRLVHASHQCKGRHTLRYIRIVNVASRRVSDIDITSRYEYYQRLGLTIDSSTGRGRLHGSECEDTAISIAIGFAYVMQNDSGQSASLNVALCDGRARVRSGARRGTADAQQCTKNDTLAR
jgi:hypothetical protein